MSIRTRLSLFGLGVATLSLITFALAFYGLFALAGPNTQDRQLASRALDAEEMIAQRPSEDFAPQRVLAPIDAGKAIDIFVIVMDVEGQPLSATGEVAGAVPAVDEEVLAAARSNGEVLATIQAADGTQLRAHIRTWQRPELGLEGFVAAVQPTRRLEEDLSGGLVFLLAASICAFLVAAAAIWLVTGRALRPLRQLAGLTDEVAQTNDMSRRLPVPSVNDDMRRFSESFNGMMERLEQANLQLAESLEVQKRFVADASHELRTPLTSIRNNAGFLVQRPDAGEVDRQAALHDIASESERMTRLVQDLLTLARADAGQHLELKPLEVTGLLKEVGRQASALHADREVRVRAEDAAEVDGNEDALKQVLWILIDNAVRHTPEGGIIWLTNSVQEGSARIAVSDDGEGIPAAALGKVFDRFYQASDARHNSGAGLGLSIASWIVGEHGGRIEAANNYAGGATIAFDLLLRSAIRQEPSLSEPV